MRERAARAIREANTTNQQNKLFREHQLRDANAEIMIAKVYRGYSSSSQFKKALQAKTADAGVSEVEIARIVGNMLREPLQNMQDVIDAL